ncbi:MAG: tRNA uridine-5-carboxymethylaminomethyl(34) synthesis GTPase MnmE [Hyphomicrobiales bacterium]|nr:tRNA uridine-5-carboxymethylaminomethyl(34) synthesis GTPase MnmE [Hyphomicrobiales bacterium]
MSSGFAETIVALSSGRLPSGIAVIRMSGSKVRFALETIAGVLPEPRRATLATFTTADGASIDSGLLLFFPGAASFTGEDSAEFQVHGGKAVVAALLETLTSLPGVRHADAGEFTRRAFLNGKLDLVESEALADLISAETEAQRRLALLNADGAQAALYSAWRGRVISAMAMIEAELDFADEADVPESVAGGVWGDIGRLVEEIQAHIAGFHRSEIIRDGYDVVIVGPPNAGKSSLLNALARRDAAIVSDEPGTTRDLVEVSLDIDGFKIRVTDTAGMRDGSGKVEAIGIERARNRAKSADLVLLLSDLSAPHVETPELGNSNIVRIGTKCDLLVDGLGKNGFDILVSSRTGRGIAELLRALGDRAVIATGDRGDVLPSRLRHVELLRDAAAGLQASLDNDGRGLELRADDLRRGAERIGRISGAVNVEDMLDVIFSQFCIGK